MLKAILLCGFLLVFTGCGSDREDFVFTNTGNNGVVVPTGRSLTVGFNPAVLTQSTDIRAQLAGVTQFRAILIDSNENVVGDDTANRTETVTFTDLTAGEYLVRIIGLDAGGNVIGYFDRIVTISDNDLSTLFEGLRLDSTPPDPSFAASQTAGPFFIFVDVPTTAVGITGFSVTAQVFDGEGNPTNSVTSGVSLVSSGVAFETAVPNQDTDATGVVVFQQLRFVENGDGTTTLTVDATGVDPATSGDITVTPAGDFFATLELISQSTAGVLQNAIGFDASISGDGRYVVFDSDADNLVPNDNNGQRDIFLRDRVAGTTIAVSVTSGGSVGDDSSFEPAISANGRFIAFSSSASDLVANDTNGSDDIFVYDRETQTMERVSIDSSGNEGDDDSFAPAISDDGQVVVFLDQSNNFDEAPTNNRTDVFAYDRGTNTLETVNVPAGIGLEFDPNISGDGRFVSYVSPNPEGLTDSNSGTEDVYVFDRTNDTRVNASTDSSGNQTTSGQTSRGGHLSADGRFIAFHSRANFGFTPDNNGAAFDVFVKDLQTDAVERVSQNDAGENGDDESFDRGISGDGRFVLTRSVASDLVANDTNGAQDVFIFDRDNDRIARVSVNSTGGQATTGSVPYAISTDGRFSVFRNGDTDLVPGDDNGVADFFTIINPFRR